MPFGRFFGTDNSYYLTAKELARGFQAFDEECDLEIWCSTKVEAASWDEDVQKWTLSVVRDGQALKMQASHVVFAVGGAGGVSIMPGLPNKEAFTGTDMHSVDFKNANAWKGKKGIVIGAGTTGHDIAFDMYTASLSSVTMVKRGPTALVLEPFVRASYDATWHDKTDGHSADREMNSMPAQIDPLHGQRGSERLGRERPSSFQAARKSRLQTRTLPRHISPPLREKGRAPCRHGQRVAQDRGRHHQAQTLHAYLVHTHGHTVRG